MTEEEHLNFDEPKSYSLAKARLYYAVFAVLFIFGGLIFEKVPFTPICFAPLAGLAIYLFLPFTYKLIVSDEAISSINLLGAKTLGWNEIAEVTTKKGGLLLANQDGDVKVFVNQQIDDYLVVIRFIQRQRPDLWKLDDAKTFHQNIIEATIFGILGLPIIYITIAVSFENGFSFSDDMLTVLLGSLMGGVLIWQGIKIREITFDMDYLVAKYLVWERRVHVSEIFR
ncbi:MAG: hypothetical protein IPP66_05095 [Anaerolineales bacterium]|nr:hypothetical protein [Anaerolineales bacterium]